VNILVSSFRGDNARSRGVCWFPSCALTSAPCLVNSRAISHQEKYKVFGFEVGQIKHFSFWVWGLCLFFKWFFLLFLALAFDIKIFHFCKSFRDFFFSEPASEMPLALAVSLKYISTQFNTRELQHCSEI
jgi:hypothetical protein